MTTITHGEASAVLYWMDISIQGEQSTLWIDVATGEFVGALGVEEKEDEYMSSWGRRGLNHGIDLLRVLRAALQEAARQGASHLYAAGGDDELNAAYARMVRRVGGKTVIMGDETIHIVPISKGRTS